MKSDGKVGGSAGRGMGYEKRRAAPFARPDVCKNGAFALKRYRKVFEVREGSWESQDSEGARENMAGDSVRAQGLP